MFKVLSLVTLLLATALAAPEGRVVGGQDAELGQFPHQILLKRSGSFTCGGSIISKDYVLTAAHCVVQSGTTPYPPSSFTVVAGSVKQGVEPVVRTGSKITVNKDYGNFLNDVALIKLSEPLEFNDHVKAIEIHEGDVPAGSDVVISGFGRLYNGGPVADHLQFNTLTALEKSECQSTTGMYHDGLICLGHKSGHGACNGDSGGPALFNGKLIGVANFVIGGCGTSYPDGYAFVPFFKEWVAANAN